MIIYVMDNIKKNVHLGLKIRLAREAKGWSQDALADELGTTQATVSGWETGTFPKRFGLPKIAEVLEKPIEWFQDASPATETPGMNFDFMIKTNQRIEDLEAATNLMQIMPRIQALELALSESEHYKGTEARLLALFRRADSTLRKAIVDYANRLVLGDQDKMDRPVRRGR